VCSSPQSFEQIRCLQLDAWMRFTSHARLLYPTFPEQSMEGKIAPVTLVKTCPKGGKVKGGLQRLRCPKGERRPCRTRVRADAGCTPYIPRRLGQDISAVWVELAAAFVSGECARKRLFQAFADYREVYDDRLFVNLVYGLSGPPLPAQELDRVFSLALFVDTGQAAWDELGGYAYAPEQVQRRMEKQGFHLWDESGQRSGFTDFSNVYMGSGSFYCNKIAGDVIAIYGRMLLQALFYRASLRWYEQRITKVTEALIKEHDRGESAKALRRDFVRFTNQCWFRDLTDQMQGREIFRLQQEALELKREYDLVKDEMERTDEFLQARYEMRMLRKTDRVIMAGAVLALLGLWLTGLPLLKDGMAGWLMDNPIQSLLGLPGFLVLVAGVLLLLWVGIVKLYHWSRE